MVSTLEEAVKSESKMKEKARDQRDGVTELLKTTEQRLEIAEKHLLDEHFEWYVEETELLNKGESNDKD